jgi:hypothetical protein
VRCNDDVLLWVCGAWYAQSDIPGTHPAWKPLHKEMLSGEARDIMRVDDISKQQFKTTRVT